MQKRARWAAVVAMVMAAAATSAFVLDGAALGAQNCRTFPGARHTIGGTYRVAMLACPTTVPVNQPTLWVVRVTTRAGRPVTGRVEVTGGMPEHRHGFLTPPVVTRSAPGVYRARLVFAMRGRWVIELRIGDRRRDVVRYQLTV